MSKFYYQSNVKVRNVIKIVKQLKYIDIIKNFRVWKTCTFFINIIINGHRCLIINYLAGSKLWPTAQLLAYLRPIRTFWCNFLWSVHLPLGVIHANKKHISTNDSLLHSLGKLALIGFNILPFNNLNYISQCNT